MAIGINLGDDYYTDDDYASFAGLRKLQKEVGVIEEPLHDYEKELGRPLTLPQLIQEHRDLTNLVKSLGLRK